MTSEMTREEAAKYLKVVLDGAKSYKAGYGDVNMILMVTDKTFEALRMAANALQTDPCETCQKVKTTFKQTANEYGVTCEPIAEPCEDAISRQAAIKAIWDGTNMDIYTSEVKEILEGLPSVQPKAKSEWIPIKTRPLTEEEKAEMDTESDYMYDCPLPDDGEEVEVTTYLGDVTLDVFCRDSSDGCYFERYCDDGDVLAWRHKPEPYRAESEVSDGQKQ